MIVEKSFTSGDGTLRFVLKLRDGEFIESVLIPRHDRATACISSQVGCGLGCAFCLTGQLGFTRDLTADEMISQVLLMLKDTTQRFSIVFMGMGEPLNNYENVMRAVRLITDAKGMSISPRRVTLSTSGIIPGIRHEPVEDQGSRAKDHGPHRRSMHLWVKLAGWHEVSAPESSIPTPERW